MKKILSLITAMALITTTTPTFTAVGNDPGADIIPPELAISEPALPLPEEETVIEDVQPLAQTNGVEYSDGNIIGGSIYYDPASGTIVDCDERVISCVIPAEIDGVKITAIGTYAFYLTDVVKVTLPDTIIDIGEYAFFDASSLQTINIPDTVTGIGNRAFDNTKIKSISTMASCTIGDYAFDNSSLESISIPNVKSIGVGAFYGCTSLSNVVLPNISTIPNLAFNYCSNLLDIELPTTVTAIGMKAFANAGLSGDFTLPESLKTIGEMAFYQSKLQGKLVIPSSVTEIGVNAFAYTGIAEIVIPGSVVNVPDGAFYYCNALAKIVLEDGVTSVGKNAFYHLTSKTCSIWLPSSLQYVLEGAFRTVSSIASSIDVYYAACSNKFNEIIFGSDNNDIANAVMHYYNGSGLDHDYQYTYDDSEHWLACKDCGLVSGEKSPHDMDGDKCTVCGYGAAEEHVHTFVYKTDVHVHWQVCEDCGFTCNVEEHTFVDDVCSKCNYKNIEAAAPGDMNADGEISLDDAIEVLKLAMRVN